MKIFGLCLIKNEEDNIKQALDSACEWADKIFVYDNGSTDKTWEIIQEMSKSNSKIVPWKSDNKHFKENLFGDIFREFRGLAKNGDWWCFLPGDEFYIDDPKTFLAGVPSGYHVVKHESIDYHLTFEDVDELQFRDDAEFDRSRIRYYNPMSYSEVRFFKHRNRLVWPVGAGYPNHVGITYPKKIRVRHYQHRSPQQIQMRLDVRRKLVEDGYKFFRHAAQTDWKEKLYHRKDLELDLGDGNWKIKGIRHDRKTTPLKLLIKKIAHKTGILP